MILKTKYSENRTLGIGGKITAVCGLLCCLSLISSAQSSLPSKERTNGALVSAAFAEQRDVLQLSTAVLYDGLDFAGYGTLVTGDGYILVKRSEFDAIKDISIRIDETQYTECTLVSKDPKWDLALLKVDAKNLTPVVWADSAELPQGSWVIANGATSRAQRRASAGIVSAKYRAVDGLAPAVLGISFSAKKDSLDVADVAADTGAERSGLQAGDIIKKFDGQQVTSRKHLIEIVREHIPGDRVALEFEREGKVMQAEIELMARADAYQEKKSRNDQMSGEVSSRRDSFPRVMQTDIRFGQPRFIGGPLLNLDGKCVGMNIARANRAESYAIPVQELREVLERLHPSEEL